MGRRWLQNSSSPFQNKRCVVCLQILGLLTSPTKPPLRDFFEIKKYFEIVEIGALSSYLPKSPVWKGGGLSVHWFRRGNISVDYRGEPSPQWPLLNRESLAHRRATMTRPVTFFTTQKSKAHISTTMTNTVM